MNRKIIIKIERKLANNVGIRKANKVVSEFCICAQVFYHGTKKPKTTQKKKKKKKKKKEGEAAVAGMKKKKKWH